MKKTSFALIITIVSCIACAPRGVGDELNNNDIEILKKTSKAFSAVANKAIPAVVFIQVEKVVEAAVRSPGYYNDPFGFFGDDFFQRFFGQRGRGYAPRSYRQMGQGSGFIISEDGYILTNNHVVGDADKITVKLHDGREFQAERIGSDPKSEVAVIKIDGEGLPVLEMGSSASLDIGEWVVAIGNPFGLAETLTVGVVSATGRSNIGIAEYEDFIQTDAAINPGNSGGPLLNIEGKVVGINTAIVSGTGGYMGIGFAIPIDMAVLIKDQLVKGGKVVRGFLGVVLNAQEVDEDMAASFGLDKAAGVLIAEVVEDSPAEKAGLNNGDIVLELNDEEVENNSWFRNKVALIEPGEKAILKVFRSGESVDLVVEIGTFPEDKAAEVAGSELVDEVGIFARDLTEDVARRFGYHEESGVIVVSVRSDSPAHYAGVQPGFLLLSMDHQELESAEQFYELLPEAAEDDRILLRVKTRDQTGFVLLRLE